MKTTTAVLTAVSGCSRVAACGCVRHSMLACDTGEFTNWAPNIVYCLGVCGNLCMDFYWEVRPSFDEAAFLKELTTTLGAKRFHTELPAMY